MFFTLSGFLIGHMWLAEVQKTGEFRCVLAACAGHMGSPACRLVSHELSGAITACCRCLQRAWPPSSNSPTSLNVRLLRRILRFLVRRFLRIWPMLALAIM